MPKKSEGEETFSDNFTPFDPNAPVDVPSEAEANRDPQAAATREQRFQQVAQAAQAAHGPESVKRGRPDFPVAPGNPHGHTEADMPKESLSPALNDAERPGLGKWRGPRANEDVTPIESDPAMLAAIQDPYGDRTPGVVPTVVGLDSYGNPVEIPV
jgi:hypothetical protein